MKLECKNCCYFNSTYEFEYDHCCFREWGHGDYEKAPCDYDDDDYEVEKEEYHLKELTDEEFIQLMLED